MGKRASKRVKKTAKSNHGASGVKKTASAARRPPIQKKASAKKTSPARKKGAAKRSSAVSGKKTTGMRKSVAARKTPVARTASGRGALDLSQIPPGLVETSVRTLCLGCVWAIFTKQLGMAARTALTAMKQHQPSADELSLPEPRRPYFQPDPKDPRCPYCDAGRSRHAALTVHRIEGSRATDALRKEILAKIPKSGGQYGVTEAKSKRQSVVYHWLENLAQRFHFDDDSWMTPAAKAFLEKRLPKVNWEEVFAKVYRVRRSSRMEEGWEVDEGRLFLAPDLYNEVLLFQYVLSRSHRYGGRTFEGRLTLMELLRRLRRRGYFEEHEIEAVDPHDVLEQLVESLDPGSATVRLYYIVDRRDFLKKLQALNSRAR